MPSLVTDAEKLAVQSLVRWVARQPQESRPHPNADIAGPLLSGKLNRFLIHHELLPFAYPFIQPCDNIPAEQKDFLKHQYYGTLHNNVFLLQEFLRIADVYNQQQIEYAPLKGMAFLAADLYGALGLLRPMCDIDILVRQDMLPLAEKCLVELGFAQELHQLKDSYWRTRGYHLEYVKRQPAGAAHVELHWNLDYPRYAPVFPGLQQRRQRICCHGREFFIFSPEDAFFSLILHQRRFGKILCFKYACDAVLLTAAPSFDWDYIIRESRRAGLRTAVYFLLEQVNLLLSNGVELPLDALGVARNRRGRINAFIRNNLFTLPAQTQKQQLSSKHLFLENFFLLHDTIRQPISQILFLPQEQFAKFNGWPPYSFKTAILYRLRILYFGFALVMLIFKKSIAKLTGMLKCMQKGCDGQR
jgi:Uncharacterised nucleotidyltransferase